MGILLPLPTFLDAITQYTGYRESNNLLRFSTGVMAAVGLGILVNVLKLMLVNLEVF